MEAKTKDSVIFVLIAVVVILSFVAISYYQNNSVLQKELNRLDSIRQPVIQSQIDSLNNNVDYHKHIADSLSRYIKTIDKKRIIIHNSYQDEINEIPFYSTTKRNRILDSIFAANGIR